MRLKSEFRRRLERLYAEIDYVLWSDECGNVSDRSLFPLLFSVFSFVWSRKSDSLFKK